jgi:D-glycero-D-manno-heptose 1,7-bisphosphate phosphatase
MEGRRVVFLDRDGVLNEKAPEGDYVKNRGEFRLLPLVPEALAALEELGFLLVVVTNQRCVARGIVSEETLEDIHERMRAELSARSVRLDAVYTCPHDMSDSCNCRKPRPGMITKAVADFRKKGVTVDLTNSYMVGDSEQDIACGKAVGLKTAKIGAPSIQADINVPSLFAFSAVLESTGKEGRKT